MSGDDFLARWSRRKRAVISAEGKPIVETDAIQDGPASEDSPAHGIAPAPDGELPPAEPLPRVEDLTAESDLSGFLGRGVPDALRQAAMRRMWTLDPAIRDYVGPAEYAWNFNDPASVPGFAAVADTVGSVLVRTGGADALGATERPERSAIQAMAEEQAERDGSSRRPGSSVRRSDAAATPSVATETPMAETPAAEAEDDPNPPPGPAPQRRHGGALPS